MEESRSSESAAAAEVPYAGPTVPAIAEASAGASSASRQVIVWKDGIPVPAAVPLIERKGMEAMASTALSLPYKVPPLVLPPEPEPDSSPLSMEIYKANKARALAEYEAEREFEGMSNVEVILIKAARQAARGAGDLSAANMLLDRVLGKPKQVSENTNLHMSYEDVLREKAARATAVPSSAPSSVVDVQAEPAPSPTSDPTSDPTSLEGLI
jgi:hypothetical protein